MNVYDKLADAKGKLLFVNFVASSHAVSSNVTKSLEDLAKQYKNIRVVTINSWEYPLVFERYNITSYPTTFIYNKQGDYVKCIKDEKAHNEYMELITKYS